MSALVVYVVMPEDKDAKYCLDGLRWIQLALLRGISSDKIFFCGNPPKPVLVKNTLNTLEEYGFHFPLQSHEVEEFFLNVTPGKDMFRETLSQVYQDESVERVTLILINHGGSKGEFGVGTDYSISDSELTEMMANVSKPTLLICSASYSRTFLHNLAAAHNDNIVRIYDTSGALGLTRNWGVKGEGGILFDLGTYLSYRLLDVFYTVHYTYDIAVALRTMKDQTYPSDNEVLCVIRIEGNSSLLANESFLGEADVPLTQPKIIFPLDYNKVNNGSTYPLIHPNLEKLIEDFKETYEVPSEFWDDCYRESVQEEVLYDPKLFSTSKDVYDFLFECDLVDKIYLGAGITYSIAKHHLFELLKEFVQNS